MNKRNGKFKFVILKALIMVLIMVFGTAGLGLLEVPIAVGAVIASLGLLWFIVCIVYNCAYKTSRVKQLESTTAENIYTHFTKRMEEVRADVENEKKKVERVLRLSLHYNISLIVAAFMISAGVCMLINFSILTDPEPLSVWERLLLMLIFAAYLYLLFGFLPVSTLITAGNAKDNERERKYSLDEKEYPLLYAVARRAAEAVGCELPFILCRALDDIDESVSEYNGVIAVFLAPTVTSLMTEGELYQVLLHEFAHAKYGDAKWLNSFHNAKVKYAAEGGKIVTFIKGLLFAKTYDKIDEATDEYRSFASLLVEQRADAAVKEHGNPQEYIDASAKGLMLMQFLGGYLPEIYYDFYEPEQPATDLFAKKRALFEERLPAIYPRRREVIVRTLAGRSDTHPTFRMRMESAGVSDFDVFKRPEGEYLEELMRYLDDCGKIYADTADWKSEREQNYIEIKARLDVYEKKIENGVEPDLFEKWDALYNYRLADPEKAVAIADELLKNRPDDVHASCIKGTILCSEDAEGGLELLRRVIDQGGALTSMRIMDMYGNAVLRTGDEELLKKFRAEQTEIAQRIMDGVKTRFTDRKPSLKQILSCDLPERELEDIKAVLDDHGKEIENVYIAKRMNGKFSVYVVVYNPVNPRAERKDDCFFDYLHMLEGRDRYFIPYYGKDKLAAAIREKGIKLK